MAYETIIHGGTLVYPDQCIRADLAISKQRIVAVGRQLTRLAGPRTTLIDARGCYVLPGLIDAHTHLDLGTGRGRTCDDFESGTRAAACGGVTTVIDFAHAEAGQSLLEGLAAWHAKAAGRACVDYAFHMAITDWPRQRRHVSRVIEQGVTTFKQYMIYAERGLRSDDAQVYEALELLRDLGALLLVHAESQELLDLFTRRCHTPEMMRRHGAYLHTLARPHVVETVAVERLISLASAARSAVYVVHVSTAESAALIRAARQAGWPILGETCPQYLVLTDQTLRRPDGHLYTCSPQPKTAADRRALWQALGDGTFDVVSTDSCSFSRKQKDAWRGDWTRLPMGMPGVETLLPLMYTLGVRRRRISINRLVELCCANPARLMGLAPQKGSLSAGADADVVIVPRTWTRVVDWRRLHGRCDWSPYQGLRLAGFPRDVLLRGAVVVRNHRFIGRPGGGQFVPRDLPRI